MPDRAGAGAVAREAARILVEEQLTDYGLAKRKALERMGLSPRGGLPDNALVQAEIIAYQRLFGGAAYVERLQQMRQRAVQAMRFLSEFDPRLSGAVVTGAISQAHHIQLHAFPEQVEAVEIFLADRGLRIEQDERDYRFSDGRVESVPLTRFLAGDMPVDVALFAAGDQRRLPRSPSDGLPAPRLTLAQAEALAAQPVMTALEPPL
jgi:hypothetical protein